MLKEVQRKIFGRIRDAGAAGNLALLDCIDRHTGAPVAVLCVAYAGNDGQHYMEPLAKLFDGNPYDEVQAPGLP